MRLALVVFGSLTLLACTSHDASRSSASHGALVDDPQPTHAANADPVGAELELDARADGSRLYGTLLPAPEGTDADRVIDAAWRDASGAITSIGRVLDARFVGADVVLVDPTHTLVVLHDGTRTELDRMAEAPLAVRAGAVVYARGDMPFFELARLELSSRAIAALTDGYAPAYSPAIDADGSIVFVSSRDGSPRLHRVRVGGDIEALPSTRRTPSSPRAPRLENGRLTFDDERGTTSVDVATGREVAR